MSKNYCAMTFSSYRAHFVLERMSYTFLVCFTLLSFMTFPSYSADQETILIVDGSGSMWGKFDKEHKIVSVRNALPKQLLPYENKGYLGIMSYGHRWKSNCRDIELIIPMSKIKASKHGKKLSRLSARGKTPITGSLKLAYSKFSPDAKMKQIILLSDGAENCRADPCAFMKELAIKDKTVTAHVITYGMGKKAAQKLQCISTATNGTFASPQNRQDLNKVLKELFSQTLNRKWKALVKAPIKPAVKIKPGLFLTAYLGKGSLQLKDKVKWLVYKNKHDAKNNIAPLMVSEKAKAVFKLESGSYFIQLINEKMGAGKELTIDKNKHQESIFRLNAGIISIIYEAKPDFLSAVRDFRVSLIPQIKGRIPIPIAFTTKNKDSFTVAAGQYKLITQLKNFRHEQTLTLKAGELKKEVIPLNAGLFSLEALQSFDGTKLKNISYKIMRKHEGGGEVYSEYSRLASASPHIVLPTGHYYVEAKSDLAVAIENFTIEAGAHHQLSLNLNAGEIVLKSKLATGKTFHNGEVTYKITQSDLSAVESQNSFFETSLTNKPINLPVGTYIISSSLGKGGSYTEQSITVEAGQTQTVDFIHKANLVTLSCTQQNAKIVRRNLFWKVMDDTGQTVARSSLASLELLLGEGQYTAQALYQGQEYITKFHVLANAKPKHVQLRVH